ncbi:MAG: hypothetical protein FD187_944 [bacterium]|nr:MAG: hypothetical protein FD142_75 [bacterium]KAF0149650.1 MAG: hypothetical protein FD187_944 [bacterium]KAF0169316.1 MAG: hypothetical protein FD158_506 [bacterium]
MVTRTATKTVQPKPSTTPTTATKPVTARKRIVKPKQPALAKPLSRDQFDALFKLIKGSTSVELKLSVPLTSHRATVKSVGLDPVEAQPRQAFFFDTPDLALNKAGVVVRARRIQGGDADTVIKLRPVDPSTIDPDLRRSAAFKIEVDVMPGGFVCSASYKGVCKGREVLDVTAGAMPLRKLFSKEQRAFYDAHAPAGITMDQLVLLGPTFLLKAKHQPKDFDRPIVVEMWLYPDGSRILEVSTKCLPKEAFEFGGAFKAYLAAHGIVLGADQSAKTRTALEYYSAGLKEAGMTD